MAVFDGHLKGAHYRDKEVGNKPCDLKKECAICKTFTPEQVQQLATPTYSSRKNREQKTVSASSESATPTIVDSSDVTLLGRVHGKQSSTTQKTLAGKKKRPNEFPKPSKKKSSSKPSIKDLKNLANIWVQA